MGYILTTVLKILRLGLLAYWVVTKQRNYFPNNLIRQLVRSPGGRVEFSNPKTRFSRRTIQIGKRTMDVLRAHLEAQQMESEEAGSGWQEHELIFTNSWGGPILARNLHRNFKQFLTDAGLQPIRFHDLRHTAASWMLLSGLVFLARSVYSPMENRGLWQDVGLARLFEYVPFYIALGVETLLGNPLLQRFTRQPSAGVVSQ